MTRLVTFWQFFFLFLETKSELPCFSCQDPVLQPGDRHYQGRPRQQDVQELRPVAQ